MIACRHLFPLTLLLVFLGASSVRAQGEALPPPARVVVTPPTAADGSLGGDSASNREVGKFARYEAVIRFTTSAADLYWPYDAAPPPGIPAGTGVGVDALLTDPEGRERTAPCFRHEDPRTGQGSWRLRFAPDRTGRWTYRIRVTDGGGTRLSDPQTFTCVSSAHPGYLRVSPVDPRYFEHADGTTFFPAPGVHEHGGDPTEIRKMAGRFTLCRVWWNGSERTPIASLSGQGGRGGWRGGQISGVAPPGRLLSMRVTAGKATEVFGGAATVGARYRLAALVKEGGSVRPDLAYDRDRTPVRERPSAFPGWRWQYIDFTATVPNIFADYVQFQAAPGTGEAFIAEASLKRLTDAVAAGPELLSIATPGVAQRYSAHFAARADEQVEAAEAAGVYLKVVLFEKHDDGWRHFTAAGTIGAAADDHFYGQSTDPQARLAVRWLQRAFTRYFAARWGWSPHVHSAEFVNEGDPFNGNHHAAANGFARFLKSVNSRPILATTSFWHSQPSFWNRTDCDYIDVHQYLGNNTFYGWPEPGRVGEQSGAPGGKALRLAGTAPSGLTHTAFFHAVPVDAAHRYRLRYRVRGLGIDRSRAVHKTGGSGLQLWLQDAPQGGQVLNEVNAANYILPEGDSNWREVESAVFALPPRAKYLTVRPHTAYVVGTAFFADVRLENVTTGRTQPLPGGTFASVAPLSEDTALALDWVWRTHAGGGGSVPRPNRMPWVWGEMGVWTPKGEDARLTQDREFVWLHKLTWACINPGAIYPLWWTDRIKGAPASSLRAWRAFMADVPLANGRYKDAEPVCTGGLRAWGQVDRQGRSAHLWVDNPNHTWAVAAAGKPRTPLSGTVTIAGLPDGGYTVETWDTRSGEVKEVARHQVRQGRLVLLVENLATDVAYKVRP